MANRRSPRCQLRRLRHDVLVRSVGFRFLKRTLTIISMFVLIGQPFWNWCVSQIRNWSRKLLQRSLQIKANQHGSGGNSIPMMGMCILDIKFRQGLWALGFMEWHGMKIFNIFQLIRHLMITFQLWCEN
jgi:hypothetical protein